MLSRCLILCLHRSLLMVGVIILKRRNSRAKMAIGKKLQNSEIQHSSCKSIQTSPWNVLYLLKDMLIRGIGNARLNYPGNLIKSRKITLDPCSVGCGNE